MHLSPVTKETHTQRYWRRPSTWEIARNRAVMPLVAAQWPRLCTVFPTGFIAQDDAYLPVTIMGVKPDQNLYVARDGSWLAGILPLPFQTLPFAIATSEHGDDILCTDESLALISDDPDQGEPFFTPEGEITPAVARIVQTLQEQNQNRSKTLSACAQLAAHGIIEPWPAIVHTHTSSGRIELAGLYCINETALNQIDGTSLKALQDIGALGMAYCQLISMQHLVHLGQLADAHSNLHKSDSAADNIDLAALFEEKGYDILKFS